MPNPDTPLVGREAEIDRLTAMVDVPGLVTVTGEGGVGKTRLVLEVARRQTRPVVFVPLVDLDRTGATLAIRRVCAPLLLSRFDAATGTLRDSPRDTSTIAHAQDPRLLVLDSVEQVGQISDLIAEIRATVPDMTILVTSRSRLGQSNERVLHLVGLPADPQGPAVQLFLARSRAVGADPAVMGNQLRAIAELCRALDGLPLAIELAAARTRLMSPAALLAQVHSPDHRRMLTLLAKGPTDLPKRQLSMRATLAWSHRLLDPADQVLFRRLGIFPGSFSLDAAEATAGSADPDAAPGEDGTSPTTCSTASPRWSTCTWSNRWIRPGTPSASASSCPTWPGRSPPSCWPPPTRARRSAATARDGAGTWSPGRTGDWHRSTSSSGSIGSIRRCRSFASVWPPARPMGRAARPAAVRRARPLLVFARHAPPRACGGARLFLDATASEGDPAVGRAALDRARTAALGWWSRLAIGSAGR